jgi:alpha-D-ribose 1-methylphosphonate 5-triphosphate synthase subunit PhnG
MARVRETVDGEVFNLGEVLVTRCEVSLDGEPGWGMAMGHDPERALCAAVVDAASRREDADGVREGLAAALAAAREARRERWATVQPTRVEFEEMA